MASTPYQTTDTVSQLLSGSASDLSGMHGTAGAQAAYVASVATTTATTTTPYGFTTSTQANAIVTSLNSVMDCLKAHGLMASS